MKIYQKLVPLMSVWVVIVNRLIGCSPKTDIIAISDFLTDPQTDRPTDTVSYI